MGTSHAHHSLRRVAGLLAVSALAACTLAACNRGKPSAATQIAATVNEEEISVHQLNFALHKQAGLKPEQIDAASRKTLEALVDQELVVQAATEQKLDRDPAVLQAIAAARRELIARAYVERLVSGLPLPSAAEVKQYYDAHPALFAKRRHYVLVDTAVEATPAQQQAIRAELPDTRNAAEVAAVLKQAGLRHGARRASGGAEALPLQAVDDIARLREGQSFLVGGPQDAHILTIVSAQPAPLTLEQARPSIEAYLSGERKRELLQQQIKSLRSDAQIAYRGRFATPAAAETAPVPTADAASALKSVAALK